MFRLWISVSLHSDVSMYLNFANFHNHPVRRVLFGMLPTVSGGAGVCIPAPCLQKLTPPSGLDWPWQPLWVSLQLSLLHGAESLASEAKETQDKYSRLGPMWSLAVRTVQGALLGNLLFTFRFSAAPHMQIQEHVGHRPGLLGDVNRNKVSLSGHQAQKHSRASHCTTSRAILKSKEAANYLPAKLTIKKEGSFTF